MNPEFSQGEPGTGNPPEMFLNADNLNGTDKAIVSGSRRDTPGGVNEAYKHPPEVPMDGYIRYPYTDAGGGV